MPRGGPRPGAGAPRGNLNALKTGAHSDRFRAVIAALLIHPDTRRVLLALVGPKRAQLQSDRMRQTLIDIARIVKEQRQTSIGQKRAPQTQEITKNAKKTKNNSSIKPRHLVSPSLDTPPRGR
jgi:hypothetical protein